jgi:hypothetical protein
MIARAHITGPISSAMPSVTFSAVLSIGDHCPRNWSSRTRPFFGSFCTSRSEAIPTGPARRYPLLRVPLACPNLIALMKPESSRVGISRAATGGRSAPSGHDTGLRARRSSFSDRRSRAHAHISAALNQKPSQWAGSGAPWPGAGQSP